METTTRTATTTIKNKNSLIESNYEGEPSRKRARFNETNNNDQVCIDLKRLMSQYNCEITTEPTVTSAKNLPSSTTEVDAGDSGFQDFTSNDSPLSQKSNLNDDDEDVNIENFNQINKVKKQQQNKQTTFSTAASADNQFTTAIQLNSNSNNNNNKSNSDYFNNLLVDNNHHSQDPIDDLADLAEDDEEDNESIVSLSDISCITLSDRDLEDLDDLEDCEKWNSNFDPVSWIQQQITSGTNPRSIIDDLIPNNLIPSKVDNFFLWKFIVNILSEPPRREKLSHINNLEDVVGLIKKSKKIIVLTGAGISVSSGIPDFRSRDGVYARLSVDFPDLPDPQAMFDINYFRKDQRPFFKFAKEIYPGQFKPSISHKFIKSIESHGKLLRNYTQNIDTLEKSANIERVINCHGSFSTASCTNCKYKVDGSFIKDDIFAQTIPRCPKCPSDCEALCVMKPDIVFFHESLTDDFHDAMALDKNECDLLIVIGSSLKVKPVALIPTSIPADVPQILINREHLSHCVFDVELLGDCDIIIQELCHRLGEDWNLICENESQLKEIQDIEFKEICNRKMSAVNGGDMIKGVSPSNLVNDSLEDKLNFTDILPDDSFVCVRPARYLFKGAEISNDCSSDDESDSENDEEPQFKEMGLTNKLDHEHNNTDDLLNNNDSELNNKPNQQNSFPIDTNNNS